MAEKRAIVGIGELLLESSTDGDYTGGLAGLAAIHAAKLGHPGIAISRLGQDSAGSQILQALQEAGVNTEHIQSDPDLATGRRVKRTIAGRNSVSLDSRAAFDNLQWDFDLEDVAQRTEAVIFGTLARRHGQARTTMDRYLAECRSAIRVFDITNRDGDTPSSRGDAIHALEIAEGIIMDSIAVSDLLPTANGETEADEILSFVRQHGLIFAIRIRDDGVWLVHSDGETFNSQGKITTEMHQAGLVALIHGLLAGWDWERCLKAGVTYSEYLRDNPTSDLPSDLL